MLGRDFVGSGSQKICQETSILGDNWVEGGWGLQRHNGGGGIRCKEGEWGGFTIWVVMSSDNGIQGAKVYGAKKIMNPWSQT